MRPTPSDIEAILDIHQIENSATRTPKTRKLRFRWNLMTLLVLMPVVATWTQYFRLRHENERLQREIQVMESQSRRLVVVQKDRLAVVNLPPSWADEQKWVMELPSEDSVANGGTTYQLCLATREINLSGTRPSAKKYTLPPGRHQIELKTRRERGNGKQSSWNIIALVDDQPVIEINESADWNPGFGGYGSGGDRFDRSYQPKNTSQSVLLFHEQFSVDQSNGQFKVPEEPSNGLLLWVQPIPQS